MYADYWLKHEAMIDIFATTPEPLNEMMKKYWASTFVPGLFNQKIYSPKDSQENGKVVGI